jgi:hypothetical protein
VGTSRTLARPRVDAVPAAVESSAEPPIALEEQLRIGLELQGCHQARDGHRRGILGEDRGQGRTQPGWTTTSSSVKATTLDQPVTWRGVARRRSDETDGADARAGSSRASTSSLLAIRSASSGRTAARSA